MQCNYNGSHTYIDKLEAEIPLEEKEKVCGRKR